MIIREITDQDYQEVLRWFKGREWPIPPIPDAAPNYGLVADNDGQLIACAFIYTTSRSMIFMDWLGLNPDVSFDVAKLGIDQIMDYLQNMCALAEPEVNAVCFFTKSEALAEQMVLKGFKKKREYIRLLWTKPLKSFHTKKNDTEAT